MWASFFFLSLGSVAFTSYVDESFHGEWHFYRRSFSFSFADDNPVQIIVTYKRKNYLICTLDRRATRQVLLDINFEYGISITFLCNGKGHVHLTGYLLPHPDWMSFQRLNYGESIDEDEDETPRISEKRSKRKAIDLKESRKIKIAKRTDRQDRSPNRKINDRDTSDDSADETNLEGDEDESMYHCLKKGLNIDKNGDEAETDEDYVYENADEEVECEEEEDEDEDEDEDENENDDDEDEDEDDDEDEDEYEDEDEDEKIQQQQKQKSEQKKLAKSQRSVKNQKQNQKQNQQDQQNKHDKKKLANGKETKQEQLQNKQQRKDQNQMKKRTVEGGVQIEDLKAGHGASAKHGKFVTVYYVGRCKIGKDEKKVDSCMQGNGFKFRLGKGDVIKGWDAGIVGMRVGGKRRLVIPPNMGYV